MTDSSSKTSPRFLVSFLIGEVGNAAWELSAVVSIWEAPKELGCFLCGISSFPASTTSIISCNESKYSFTESFRT